jgi:tetratricopeptide (TPR) repeat protein
MNTSGYSVRIKWWARGLLLLLVAGLLAGCATKINMTMLLPAQYHEASLTKSVAVLPFNGPDGEAAAVELEGVLAGVNIDDKQYFTVVDRSAIDKTVSELKLGQSGLVDERTAAKIGNLLGAEGIYTGVVTRSSWDDSPYREKRHECVRHEVLRDKKGRTYEGECINWRDRDVPCLRRVAGFTCSPKLIDVRTGRVLYTRTISGSASDSSCEDRRPVLSGEDLLKKARDIAKAEFMKDVAPHYITRQITLMNDTAGISSGDAKDKLKRGLDYAANGRMDQACELWGESRILSPSSPSVLYDLGICAEARGDLDAALILYRDADKQLGKPDDRITLALDRTREAIKNRTKLQEQLKK